jgi:hypothetical protein
MMDYVGIYSPILAQLQNLRATGEGRWTSSCPSHHDLEPRLSLRIGKRGELLVNCHSGTGRGCPFPAIATALGREGREFFAEFYTGARTTNAAKRIDRTYDYIDSIGELRYQTVRYVPKDFRQRRPDPKAKGQWINNLDGVELIPFRLPQLLSSGEQTVCVVEGEKDVESLERLGLVATCNAAGSGKWSPAWNQLFAARRVAVFPDRDAAGFGHALDVATCLESAAETVRIVELPGRKLKDDVSDYLETLDCSVEEKRRILVERIRSAPLWLGANRRPVEELAELRYLMARALVMSKVG